MEMVYPRAAGLDVHKKTVVACVITPEVRETRTVGTMTGDLHALKDWLQKCKVSHVAMESTGVFWKPVWNLLEAEFTLFLVNSRHIKNVPGRKTDVKSLPRRRPGTLNGLSTSCGMGLSEAALCRTAS